MKTLLILPIFLVFISCSDKTTTKENNPAETNRITMSDTQLKNAGVVIGTVQTKTISSTLKVSGKIDVPPQNMLTISAILGGYLKSTHLLPGMKVKKGEIIGIMEDPQYIQLQQDYLTAKTRFVFDEAEYERQKELNKSKASSDKQFQLAEAQFKSQKILVKSLSEKLKLININPEQLSENNISRTIDLYSPIDGYVSKVDVNIGKYLNPGEIIFELVNTNDIHLALTVYEKDIDKLFIGQKVIAYNNMDRNQKHEAEIILISQSIADDRSVIVHCHFHNYDKTLLPGMYMNAEIEVPGHKALVVPEDAVVNYEGKDYVFKPSGPRAFELIEVETSSSANGVIEILPNKNLNDSIKIVTKGAYALLSSLKNKSE